MEVVGLVALCFSIYAGYSKWPWWIAAMVGGLVAIGVCLWRLSTTPLKDRIASGDPDATGTAVKASFVSGAGGAAFHTVVYSISFWLTK